MTEPLWVWCYLRNWSSNFPVLSFLSFYCPRSSEISFSSLGLKKNPLKNLENIFFFQLVVGFLWKRHFGGFSDVIWWLMFEINGFSKFSWFTRFLSFWPAPFFMNELSIDSLKPLMKIAERWSNSFLFNLNDLMKHLLVPQGSFI